MEYRNLGNSGLQVSVVGLGCNNFGGPVDAAGTQAMVDKCIEEGITFFDTADVYGWGHSERLLGKALHGRRDDVVIATKVGGDFYHGGVRLNFSPEYIRFAVQKSLERLQTDRIDVYQLHVWLREISPLIWRRMLVRSDSTIADLHQTLIKTPRSRLRH